MRTATSFEHVKPASAARKAMLTIRKLNNVTACSRNPSPAMRAVLHHVSTRSLCWPHGTGQRPKGASARVRGGLLHQGTRAPPAAQNVAEPPERFLRKHHHGRRPARRRPFNGPARRASARRQGRLTQADFAGISPDARRSGTNAQVRVATVSVLLRDAARAVLAATRQRAVVPAAQYRGLIPAVSSRISAATRGETFRVRCNCAIGHNQFE